LTIFGNEAEKEDAAFLLWAQALTPQQRSRLAKEYPAYIVGEQGKYIPSETQAWEHMSSQQRLKVLGETSANLNEDGSLTINNHYDNSVRFNQTPPDAQPRSNGGL
jgi:hypothetical protein